MSSWEMVIKCIKGFIKKPIAILTSIYYRYNNTNEDLARKRQIICNKCSHKISTSLGDACDECGCILDNKTRLEDEHCDLCKW